MEEFILVDRYSRFIPDLIPYQSKAIIHNKMCTYIRTNYLGNLTFSIDDDPTKTITLNSEEFFILYRNEFVDSDVASNTMRKKVKTLFGKERW